MAISVKVKKIDWVNTLFLLSTPFLALTLTLYSWLYDLITWPQLLIFFFMYIATGLSITAGYHRLLSHRSYKTNSLVRLFFLCFGAAAFENSALKWCNDHRLHHAHEDGPLDPYNIKKGFFYAHMGWILWQEPQLDGPNLCKDLERDPLIMWQKRYCLPLAVLFGLLLPALLGHFFGGSWVAGLALGGFLRLVVVHHATFSINSLCHLYGKASYDQKLSAKDNRWLAFLTYGEGHHNFHHCFPSDYRNGVRWFDYDPTKWLIKGLSYLGLTWQLKTAKARSLGPL